MSAVRKVCSIGLPRLDLVPELKPSVCSELNTLFTVLPDMTEMLHLRQDTDC
jgi:hypothetical protein